MLDIHPQYIRDVAGNKSLVILTVKEFESMIEELDELEDVRLFDEAKNEDKGERVLFSDYLNSRKSDNGNL